MKDLWEALNAGWIGNLLGVIGLLAGYLFYKRSLKYTRISHQHSSFDVIGHWIPRDIVQDLSVSFRGEAVPQLAVCEVTLWNSGNDTVMGDAISTSDPLRIKSYEEGRIISAEVVKVTRPGCGIKLVNPNGGNISRLVVFDFLDPGDGAIIKVIHTGRMSWTPLEGTVRATKIEEARSGYIDPWKRILAIVISNALTLLGCAYLTYIVTRALQENDVVGMNVQVVRVVLLVMMSVLLYTTWNYAFPRYQKGRSPLPAELRSTDER